MIKVDIAVAKAVPEGLVEELQKKSVYCSTHLRAIEVLNNGSTVSITVDDRNHVDEVKSKVERFVLAMVKGYRHFDKKCVFSNEVRPTYASGVWEEMLARRWAFDCGFGQVGLRGPALVLYEYFDEYVTTMARERFAADAHRFPVLLPAEVMGKCGYFSSFPQAVTFVAHLKGDFDTLEEFSLANKSGPLTFPGLDVLEKPEYCLTPLVCYHCYRTLEGQKLAEDETRVFTAASPCFRFESRNTTSLERLWNFNMREIVFVGSRESVKNLRQDCIDIVGSWIRRLGIEARFETASDPFFTVDFSEKRYFQLLSDLKYEMRLNVEEGRTIAAGSFNLANDFFGKTFSISSGSGPAFTSCIGFGLERWVYAFICQKGFDVARWPEEILVRLRSQLATGSTR